MLKQETISIVKTLKCYPKSFFPPEIFQEFKNRGIQNKTNPNNHVYHSIRKILEDLDLDNQNKNTENWNPLSEYIKQGNIVLIKPNLVRDFSSLKGGKLDELIVNGSIIWAVVDYVSLALNYEGTIIIGDASIQQTNFDKIINFLKLRELKELYSSFPNLKIEISDFRIERVYTNRIKVIVKREKLKGDPRKNSIIDLQHESALHDISESYEDFRVTQYNKFKMREAHNLFNHKYKIANSVLAADVVISIAKLKTHKKAGITGGLKNIVGINVSKDYLPHHRKGSIEEKGDEYLYKSLRKRIITNLKEKVDTIRSKLIKNLLIYLYLIIYFTKTFISFKDQYFEGSWWGNETIPRTIIDLNRILYFADKSGKIKSTPQRKVLTITDGIIAGEHNGPLHPKPKPLGIIIASTNPVIHDYVSAVIMGFNPYKIPTLKFAMDRKYKLTNTDVKETKIVIQGTHFKELSIKEIRNHFNYKFEPADGWKGYIELEE